MPTKASAPNSNKKMEYSRDTAGKQFATASTSHTRHAPETSISSFGVISAKYSPGANASGTSATVRSSIQNAGADRHPTAEDGGLIGIEV
jgi:hypothetical protein